MEFFKRFSRETNPEHSPIKEPRQITSFEELKSTTDEVYELEDALDTFLIWRESLIREAQHVGDGMTGADHDLIFRKANTLAEQFKAKGFIMNAQLLVDCPYSL
jgi:hypothetical protein